MARRRRRVVRGASAFNLRDRTTIRSLTRGDVVETFSGLQKFFPGSQWVGRTNRYSRDTVMRIRSDLAQGAIRHPRQLAQYICASSLLHCADGWSYLGRSISSLMRGDPHRSRHLAYYAELRAALSLLASEGLGIFQNQHFAISGANSVVKLDTKKRTHEVVWNCLEYWGKRPRSGDLFSSVVRPYGRTLDDWFAPIGGGSTVAAQAHQWFHQWGMDLKTFADDRNARNVSSYRPDGIPDSWMVNAPETLEYIKSIWEALEPASNSTFEAIDSQILRIALEGRYKGEFGVTPTSDPDRFRAWSETVVKYQGLTPPVQESWVSFLTRQRSGDDAAIFQFSKEPPVRQGNSHLGVISRAILLLRIAAGAARGLIGDAGLSSETIAFWWRSVGHARGIWDGDPEGELVDLWADVSPLLEDLRSFQKNYSAAEQTFFRATNELGPAIIGLASCERVAIWSMTPSQ
jgi:hypothetical protein